MAVRNTQEPVEVLAQPTTVEARVTQVGVEVLAQPTSLAARITQLAVEVLFEQTAPPPSPAVPALKLMGAGV